MLVLRAPPRLSGVVGLGVVAQEGGGAGMKEYVAVPFSLKAAIELVRQWHRHLPRLQGGMWAIACRCIYDSDISGVAIVGRPCRALDDGVTLEITRLAIKPDRPRPNACSFLLGACDRAAAAMGATLTTLTREDEPGTSLKAAGWVQVATTKPHQWSCQSRPREPNELIPKKRWWSQRSLRKREVQS